MKNIVIGGLFLLGGLSGQLVLRGTGSSGALALVGLVLIVVGVIQLGASSGNNDYAATPNEANRERDEEQWAEYQRAKAEAAEKHAQAKMKAELERLQSESPAVRAQVSELLEKTQGHLEPQAQLTLALETARRMSATGPA